VASARPTQATIVTVPQYLAAVRAMHGLAMADMARALRVSPSIVRRWLRGSLVPGWRRIKSLTALWGGDAELLALGASLQRYCRTTGLPLDEAVRMVRSGRRTGPQRRQVARPRDRRQLSLPMARG
jgi:transcriptional regulator with XRE-family HTH domain